MSGLGAFTDVSATGLTVTGTSTLSSLDAATADIDAGTIDGVTIGYDTSGLGAFTDVSATGLTDVLYIKFIRLQQLTLTLVQLIM